MTAEALTIARPPWSIVCWCDHENIYVELPTKPPNPPYIVKFALTESGLTKALDIMRAQHREFGTRVNGRAVALSTKHPLVKRKETTYKTTEKERSDVRDILRRRGLL